MPELPEVETVVGDLRKELHLSDTYDFSTNPNLSSYPEVSKVFVYSKKLRWDIPSLDHLVGKHILSLSRRGKYILIQFEDGKLIVHLGMTGVLHWGEEEPSKHTHVDIVLRVPQHQAPTTKNKFEVKTLRYTDPRRFGLVVWEPKGEIHKVLQSMGPEPLENWDWTDLKTSLSGKKIAIKKAIMDNTVVVGVGNIYASEALHVANIHPQTLTSSLSDKNIQALHQGIIEVLKKGIQHRGASIRDYQHVDGSRGQMSDHLLVYGRTGLKCRRCSTNICSEMMGGRNTFFCPFCQKQPTKKQKETRK